MKKYDKVQGVIFVLLGCTGIFFIFYHILSFEKFAVDNIDLYYPVNTSNNRSGWNCLAYFTFLSNLFADVYLILLGVFKLGVTGLKNIAYNSYIQGMVTTYMFVTGLIYCVVLWPHIEFYSWDGPMFFSNIINLWNHVFMPTFITFLWFTLKADIKLKNKFVFIALIFPIVYFVFSLIRGATISPAWYPYPFLHPKLLWETIFGNTVFNDVLGYVIFVGYIVGIAVLFIVVATVLKKIRNKQILKREVVIKHRKKIV